MTPAEASLAVQRLRPVAVGWGRSYGLADADAEDVAHEAVVLLLERARDIGPAAADSYLRTTVWRMASGRHRPSRVVFVAEPPDMAAEGTPETTLVSAQLNAAVQAALGRVPESRRTTVVEVLGEGRSRADVAAEQGVPESTARRRACDGADDLRADLHRQRVAEQRRTGGFASWCALLGIQDVRVLARRVTAFGAAAAGGALLHMQLGGEQLGPTPVEAPTRAAFVEPLVQPAAATAERGVEAPVATATSTTPGPRARHDVAARMLRERLEHTR